jgi:hypothetical protein
LTTSPLEPLIALSPIVSILDIYHPLPRPSVMPEPSETRGLPLDPTTKQLQQPEGNTAHQPTSSHSQLHQTSLSPNDQRERSKSTSPRRRPGTTIQAPSGPHTGPSRSEQRSTDSPAMMASHLSSVHYTRTGRISKAKKGLKVHNCENCGRVSSIPYIPSSPPR